MINDFKKGYLNESKQFMFDSAGIDLAQYSEAALTERLENLCSIKCDMMPAMAKALVLHEIEKTQYHLAKKHLLENSFDYDYSLSYTPYFTDKEINELLDENALQSSTYKLIMTPSTVYSTKNKVIDLQRQLAQTIDPDEIKRIKDEIIMYGWNPEINYEEAPLGKIESRMVEQYERELEPYTFIDCTSLYLPKISLVESASNVQPMFIILTDNYQYAVMRGYFSENANGPQLLRSMGNLVVYGAFTEHAKSPKVELNQYVCSYPISRNVIAAREFGRIIDEVSLDEPDDYVKGNEKKIVKKLYDGPFNEIRLKDIDEYCRYSLSFQSKPVYVFTEFVASS